ncbi:MAG: NAD+ synthase [Candidatus Nitrosocaldus sp.]
MVLDDIVKRIVSSLDYGYVSSKIEDFLLENLEGSGKAGYVLGLSGGLDSSVVAVLAARAIYGRGKGNGNGNGNLTALIIPHSGITPSSDVNDAIRLAESLKITYRVIDIGDIHSSLVERLHTIGGGESYSSSSGVDKIRLKIAAGNLLARLRMCILYHYANANDYLVLGTSDRSELMIGYYTKYGDGAADILPIADLYKVQVRALAGYLQIDDAIIRKRSGPMLWKEHYAEQELGMRYEEIDSILYCLLDLKSSIKDTTSMLRIEEEKVRRVLRLIRSNRHKRAPPRICDI